MNKAILFRKGFCDDDTELIFAREYFDVKHFRTELKDSLVIGRYSVLPYYKELEFDLSKRGCVLINSYTQHKWIANFEYYDVIKDYTFPTWTDYDFYECKYKGPFVVKGRTNSRKNQWQRRMFAENKLEAIKIASDLAADDDLIATQGILYRKYIPLKTYETGINGIRFTNEWRFFFLRDEIICYDYYWSNASKEAKDLAAKDFKFDCLNLAIKLGKIVGNYVNFFVLDIAQKEDGDWILVEINDGQMSGLGDNNPDLLYKNLAYLLKEKIYGCLARGDLD